MTLGHTLSQAELDRLADEVLTLIEIEESRLLSWGFFRVQRNLRADLPDLIERLPPLGRALWDHAQTCAVTSDHLLDNLLERGLVFDSQGRHRSRFAEATRLLFLLRQRFSDEDWQDAPRLVSDLRLQLRRRRYPRRDVPAQQLLDTLVSLGVNPIERDCVVALLRGSDGTPINIARFQLDAAVRQLTALHAGGDHGVVIGAGTGAGKTKAFYIPALAHIAGLLGGDAWTKALAIYPRIELLKDQIAETFSEARKLDTTLRAHKLPSVAIGAYYGDTPRDARQLLDQSAQRRAGWDETVARDGWIFPAMPCPQCQSELVWQRRDVEAEAKENKIGSYGQYARLRCQGCRFEAGPDQIALTREQMIRRPPDVLFTTTETLNRRLSRSAERALFGVGGSRPPQLMLLDEIHTYHGMGGAQIAYLLRRWRHARRRVRGEGLVIVGLSATLTRAESFFARLTGLATGQVSYIAPGEADLVEEGIEYNLVLKGDPVSGTSLLSTSVQTTMLLGRILDTAPSPASTPISRGAHGHKIFAFTDTLDVINRWFHIEQDAETNQVLSRLRAAPRRASRDEKLRRNEAGQWWWVCEKIGHDLDAPLPLDLTSSQYRGVRPDARLVVATSTLEVGFNDPAVGAVVQHKAPRSMASFLQRKGRAGRVRRMRPWMIVVTSAYGRDRWTFQHAEALFSPALPPIELPLENIYVRKMQACYALMDWLADRLAQRGAKVDAWSLLSGVERSSWLQALRRAACAVFQEILAGGPALVDLRAHLDAALALHGEREPIETILWAEPRPLLLEVVPTLLRQLESSWQLVEGGDVEQWSDYLASSPMPEFVTPNLFSQLSLPELVLHIPEDTRDDGTRRDETMGLVQGMSEFTPGHVSKRFARRHLLREAHWLALPDDSSIVAGRVQLRDLALGREPTPLVASLDGEDVLIYRPTAYTLAIVPQTVLPTSSARLLWRSAFAPYSTGVGDVIGDEGNGCVLRLPDDSRWGAVITEIRALTQSAGAWVEVTRGAVGVRAETRYRRGTEQRRRLRFAEGDRPAGLGFHLYVDALRVQFAPLDAASLITSDRWPDLCQHLLPSYALHHLSIDPRVMAYELSDFEIGWLWQLEISMLVAVAVAQGLELHAAAGEVARGRRALIQRTMDVIFQSQGAEEDDEIERAGRLRERLSSLSADEGIAAALSESSAVLWSAPGEGLVRWLELCYASSLGAAMFDAVTRVIPDIDPDDLAMDVIDDTIWIAEQAPGGIGVIERITDALMRRPRDLELQLLDTVRHCDRALLAGQLSAVAALADVGDIDLAASFAMARSAVDVADQDQALDAIRSALERHGIPLTRDLAVALSSKFLRPSSGPDTDMLVAALNQRWREEQARLGCEIDIRVMAVAAQKIPQISRMVDAALSRVGGRGASDESQVFNLLQSLLWLDCRSSCPDCIDRSQPYQHLPTPSRALLRALVDIQTAPIMFREEGWQERTLAQLSERFVCQIVCDQQHLGELRASVTGMVVSPIEIGFQQHYPAIERVERSGRLWTVSLMIRELAQQ